LAKRADHENRVRALADLATLNHVADRTFVGLIWRDAEGAIVDCNDAAACLLGVRREELIGRVAGDHVWDSINEDGTLRPASQMPSVMAAQTGEPQLNVVLGTENWTQARRWLRSDTFPLFDGETVSGTMTVVVDITEEINSRRQLDIASAITHTIFAGHDEATCLQRVCEILVEFGGLALAWVGEESGRDDGVVAVRYAAGVTQYLYDDIVSWWDTKASGQGPTGTALRTETTQVANDLAVQAGYDVWRERAQAFHLGSSVAIPLRLSGRRAVLTFYDHARYAFDASAVARYEELVREIEFGLEHVNAVATTQAALAETTAAMSALTRAQEALGDSEQRFRIAFEGNMAPMIFTGLEDEVIAVNDAFCRLIGRTREEILEYHWPPYTHPDDLAITAEAHQRLLSGEIDQIRYVKRYLHRDGHTIVVEVSKHAARDEDGNLLYAVLSARDITEERALTEMLSHQALHDPLTGLANRALFDDRLVQAISRAHRSGATGAVLLVDLDDFKGVNDTHGHLVGDEVLRGVAQRLAMVTRTTDSLSRFGGDEFFYLAEELHDASEADQIAQRLLSVLEESFDFNGLHFRQFASIGIAIFDDDVSASEYVQRADLALYEAKSRGKGRVAVFTPDLHQVAANRFALTQELHQARRSGDLTMHYQPIVDLATYRVVGFEALMRWQHPLRGAIPPSEFIPLAERGGQIFELGEFALREATNAAASWPVARGYDAPYVTVNLSAMQFEGPDLVSTVADALRASGLAPRRLIVEITESVMINESHDALRVLHELAGLGVGVALDDFGTGYSSLSYLVRLEPTIIKIDQYFVSPSFESAHNETLLEAVVSLGDRLGITMVAEGVETLAQLEQLRTLGCDCAQGYLFSPAVSPKEVAALIERGPWPDPRLRAV
jgi:diguanylate cyclase (GGDEF)-like protein/PAS domain S-box-containing protein